MKSALKEEKEHPEKKASKNVLENKKLANVAKKATTKKKNDDAVPDWYCVVCVGANSVRKVGWKKCLVEDCESWVHNNCFARRFLCDVCSI